MLVTQPVRSGYKWVVDGTLKHQAAKEHFQHRSDCIAVAWGDLRVDHQLDHHEQGLHFFLMLLDVHFLDCPQVGYPVDCTSQGYGLKRKHW